MNKLNTKRLGKLTAIIVHIAVVVNLLLALSYYQASINFVELGSEFSNCEEVGRASIGDIKDLARAANKGLPLNANGLPMSDQELYDSAYNNCKSNLDYINLDRRIDVDEQLTQHLNTGLGLLLGYWLLRWLYRYLFSGNRQTPSSQSAKSID